MSTSDSELRLRHLDALQGVITRLGQNSFAIRGWSVTLVSAVFAVISTQGQRTHHLVLFALGPAWIFWILDAFYLRQERLYRSLYRAAARSLTDSTAASVAPFDMDTTPYRSSISSWPRTLSTPHVAAIPVLLTVLVIGYWFVS